MNLKTSGFMKKTYNVKKWEQRHRQKMNKYWDNQNYTTNCLCESRAAGDCGFDIENTYVA